MHALEPLLQKSISQYQSILELSKETVTRLDVLKPAEINTACEQMTSLQQQAAETDTEIIQLASTFSTPQVRQAPSFDKRLGLMRRVLEQNNLLFSRINGMMAVISQDISQIRWGFSAMSGYKSEQEDSGKIVSHSC